MSLMEKYTVDLDKVLNDFEFSEYSLETAKTENDYANQTDSVVRHSINNVFQNLNEIISLQVDTEQEGNLVKPPEESNNETDTEKTEQIETDMTINDNNEFSAAEASENVNNHSLVRETSDEEIEINDEELIKIDVTVPDIVNESNIGEIKMESLKECINVIDILENVTNDEAVKNLAKLVEITDKPSEIPTPSVELKGSPKSVEISDEQLQNPPDQAEISSKRVESSSERAETPTEQVKIPPKQVELPTEEIETPSKWIENSVEQIETPIERIETSVERVETPIERIETPVEQVETLVEQVETQVERIETPVERVETPVNIVEQVETQVERIETPVERVETPVKQVETPVERIETSANRIEISVEPVGFQEVEMDEGDIEEYFQALEQEIKSEANTQIVEEEQVSVEAEKNSTRPNELELKIDDEEKKIDLIGEPGSTPFNNVVVAEELEAPKRPISPTYSTVSTVSISSSSGNSSRDMEYDEAVSATPHEEKPPESEVPTEELLPEPEDQQSVSDTDPVAPTETEPMEAVSDAPIVPTETSTENEWLGKRAPLWIPDAVAIGCLHCDTKFTVIKRRHHCRACGLVLCSKCCGLKHRLEYLDAEARVCNKCFDVLSRGGGGDAESLPAHPNPNNPAEYCSTIPPAQQADAAAAPPAAVMVPVGVLKRKGSNKSKHNKSVMFCDGIRPGSDLTSLDTDFDYVRTKRSLTSDRSIKRSDLYDPETRCFVPSGDDLLPPTVTIYKSDVTYSQCDNGPAIVERLENEQLTFALHPNVFVHVKIIDMKCCVGKKAWCFSTDGLVSVGQDEIVILLEHVDDERSVPRDVLLHLNRIYLDAVRGNAVKELGLSLVDASEGGAFLGSRNHAGFVYVKPSFQCLQNVIAPKEPYLIGILIHRWETPWAKLFPLRLVLRLGAEYRYYPCPIVSTRQRDSVFVEVGHTIINLLADFRDYAYTLPQIRGLTIHMSDKQTTVCIPSNRYDQVMKAVNDSSDHILAFAGSFSPAADSHLVCIQDTHGTGGAYTTHAININNKPRTVTGASFVVLNGSLKSNSGLTAKSSIVEDGLMIHILPEHMTQVRDALRNMRDHTIRCGCVDSTADETVTITWGEPDASFNTGVASPIDALSLSGKPSIRVHNGKDYLCNSGGRLIRWTEVFIIQSEGEAAKNQDPVDVSKISESVAKATCEALVKYLDLLVSNSFYKIGIRATLHVENVSYMAGSNNVKLPPIYMKSLDNELIPVLHRITSNNQTDNPIVLELIFRILNCV